MLYVFHVDAGMMITFDMSLALESVSSLKQAIERRTKLPASSLVLLVSGGEVLQAGHKVSSYSAGTDTNPIFMFSRPSFVDENKQFSSDYDCDLSPTVELSSSSESEWRCSCDLKPAVDLKQAVDSCCALPPCLSTVNSCASLAQQFSEYAKEYTKNCEQLVHDQHLQHQGWAAVVANLEDIYSEFCERSLTFKESFKSYRQQKEEYKDLLANVKNVLATLNKIPMLEALQANALANPFTAFDDYDDGFNGFDDLPAQIDNYADKGVADFGAHPFKFSEEDVSTGKHWDGSSEQKDLNNSEEDGVTFEAQQSPEVREHPTLLHWIMARENKDSLLDILDYCTKGLMVMEADQSRDAEAELMKLLAFANSHGLKQIKGIEGRLYGLEELMAEVKNIQRTQNDLANALLQNQQRLSHVSDPSVLPTLCTSHRLQLQAMLKNHEKLLDIRSRIHKSKEELGTILKARLNTVLRIENLMASADASQLLNFQCSRRLQHYFTAMRQLTRAPPLFTRALHEVLRRRAFSNVFMEWATELSTHLHKIHQEEVRRRREFNDHFSKHFLTKLFMGTEDLPPSYGTQAPLPFDSRLPGVTEEDAKLIDSTFPELAAEVKKCDMEHVVQFFKSRMDNIKMGNESVDQPIIERDLESEAETAGFEKVSGSVSVGRRPSVAVETEENMFTEQILSDKLKKCLIDIRAIFRLTLALIRGELYKIKKEYEDRSESMRCGWDQLREAIQKCERDNDTRYREQTQRLTFDHELELSDVKKDLEKKEENISSLTEERNNQEIKHKKEVDALRQVQRDLHNDLDKSKEQIVELERKIEECENNKQREIKEMLEKLTLEHKAEIETMKSRFRLVALTNMDRSPSESSLEKIERTDVIEITSHNVILRQTQENAEAEKEEAVRQAVAKCEAEWKHKFQEDASKAESAGDVLRRMLEEKDRQLEKLREKEAQLTRDVNKYRHSLQQIADEAPVVKPEKTASTWNGHSPIGLSAGSLNVSGCSTGSTVLLLWDPTHHNYTVLQEASILYFVHADCLPALDLEINIKRESERKQYALAIVDSTEYCYAKKSSNRYKVSRGSRFYRVRVKPLPRSVPPPSCCRLQAEAAGEGAGRGAARAVVSRRRVNKWLVYQQPELSKVWSQDLSQSTDEGIKSGTDQSKSEPKSSSKKSLLTSTSKLEESTAVCMEESTMPCPHEENLDSIETNEDQYKPGIQENVEDELDGKEPDVRIVVTTSEDSSSDKGADSDDGSSKKSGKPEGSGDHVLGVLTENVESELAEEATP